jgi:hypothetical protein
MGANMVCATGAVRARRKCVHDGRSFFGIAATGFGVMIAAMRKAGIGLGLALIVAIGVAGWWRGRTVPPAAPAAVVAGEPEGKKSETKPSDPLSPPKAPLDPDQERRRVQLVGEAKASLLGKIAKDYEEMTTEAAAKFSQQGAAYPGGFSAYLRQLALLERSKWEDFAKILTPRELENLQMLEHHAGKLVNQYLGNAGATEEQRRDVFRLQREFDDKYALIFEFTPAGLHGREVERQALQERVYARLGPDLFKSWVRSEGGDYDLLAQYAAQSGIRAEAPVEVWRVKNEFIRRRLEINAQGGPTAALQQQALVEQTRAKLVTLLGPGALQAGAAIGLKWLPQK